MTSNSRQDDRLRSERQRLATFSGWSAEAPVYPGDLAEAGFYYLGYQDKVHCAFDRCVLSQWEVGDSPMGEHRKHFPQCLFVRDPQGVGNMSDLYPSVQESQPVQVEQESTVASPQYKSYDARYQTYFNYPKGGSQTPSQLAEAGFYHTGKNDEVKCFYCDGGLRNWDPNDTPWSEHARWFPKCQFVLNVLGEQAVESIVRRYSSEETQVKTTANLQPTVPKPEEIMVKYLNSSYTDEALRRGFSLSQVEEAVTKQVSLTGTPFRNPMELVDAIQWLNISNSSSRQLGRNDDTNVKSPFSVQNYGNIPQPTAPSHQLRMFQQTSSNAAPFPSHNNASRAPGRQAWPSPQPVPHQKEEDMEVNQYQAATKVTPAAHSKGSDQEKEELKKKVESLEEEKFCKVCMDKEVSIVFRDCGHFVCCETCAKKVRNCPMCRQAIKERIKTFK